MAGAEELFLEAISYDPNLFTAKNNLVLARAAQGNYQLPLVRMTQVERAQLLHTAALAAIRQGRSAPGATCCPRRSTPIRSISRLPCARSGRSMRTSENATVSPRLHLRAGRNPCR
jgi:hypothetical protein